MVFPLVVWLTTITRPSTQCYVHGPMPGLNIQHLGIHHNSIHNHLICSSLTSINSPGQLALLWNHHHTFISLLHLLLLLLLLHSPLSLSLPQSFKKISNEQSLLRRNLSRSLTLGFTGLVASSLVSSSLPPASPLPYLRKDGASLPAFPPLPRLPKLVKTPAPRKIRPLDIASLVVFLPFTKPLSHKPPLL